jgi:hypothetical protein
MDRSGALVYATVGVILAVTLLSGPAIGLVDLTTPRYDMTGLGEGSITVDRVDAPSAVLLERGYQSQSYYLTVPDARVNVTAISGRPTVAYGIDIDALGYSRSTTHFLSPDDTGWVSLSVREDTLPDANVDASSYDGRLTLVARAGNETTVLHDGHVTVEVRE